MLGHHSSLSAPTMHSGLSTGDRLGMSGEGGSAGGAGGGGGGVDGGAGGGSTIDFSGSKLVRSALARLVLFRLIAESWQCSHFAYSLRRPYTSISQ